LACFTVARLSSRLRLASASCALGLFIAGRAADAAPETETASPPRIALRVTPGGSPGAPQWRLQILNTGEGPVRLVADPHLLSLDLEPPAASTEAADKKVRKNAQRSAPTTTRCVLPGDARPTTDTGSELVIPAGRSWSVTFDPRFYCFGPRERALLVAGTSVTARFGWPPPAPAAARRNGGGPAAAPAAPFAVSPVGASVGKISPVKEIQGASFTLSEGVELEKTAPAEPGATDEVVLTVPGTLDAARGYELTAPVTLVNHGNTPITLLYRADVVVFTVEGPGGTVSCGQPRQIAAPIRELFETIPAHGRAETTVLFTGTCPAGAFDDPGLYRVTPSLDTTGASGRSTGLKTWDGVARSKSPLLVRIRTPRQPGAAPRPILD
jgi:hypothetical protein